MLYYKQIVAGTHVLNGGNFVVSHDKEYFFIRKMDGLTASFLPLEELIRQLSITET